MQPLACTSATPALRQRVASGTHPRPATPALYPYWHLFGSPPRGRPHTHPDGCHHDPGRVPKDLNESARISERRRHFKAIIPKYLREPNLRPETDHAPTCRRQPAPRPCRPPPTLDGDRSAVQPRRVRGPITCPEQDQKRLAGYVLYYGFLKKLFFFPTRGNFLGARLEGGWRLPLVKHLKF